MSEHKNKLFGVISHWVVYLTLVTLLIPALLAVYWLAEKVVTYGSLPEQLTSIRTEMTNGLASFKYDNDSQHQALRKEMARRFDRLETRLDQLQGTRTLPSGFLSTNPVILLSTVVRTNQPAYNAKLEN